MGVGEKMDSLEQFFPERMAGRILGMGDMLTLYEKAASTIKEEDAQAQVWGVLCVALADTSGSIINGSLDPIFFLLTLKSSSFAYLFPQSG